MSKGIRITKKTFDLLFEKIEEQFYQECDSIGVPRPEENSKFFYGYGTGYSANEPNVCRSMEDHTKIKSYLKSNKIKSFSGKKLYDLRLELREKNESFATTVLKKPYSEAYFNYIGYDNLSTFINDFLFEEDLVHQITLMYAEEEKLTELATWYKGFYYSFKNHAILNFSFAIDYYNNKFTEVTGFYNEAPNISYNGKATYQNKSLFLNLSNHEEDRLNIILSSGASYWDGKIINGVYQGVSPSTPLDLRVGELVLLKKENKESHIDPNEELQVYRYLMLQRKKERVRGEKYPGFKAMRSSGNKINEIENVVGSYRLWGVNREGDIFQSRFVIKETFEAYLESPNIEGKQVCLLKLNRTDSKGHLCVTCHQPEGTSITSYSILELPNRPRKDKLLFLEGAFSMFGSTNGVFSSYVVLSKESNVENIEVKVFESAMQLESEIEENPRLVEMKERLVLLLKRNKLKPKIK